MAKRSRKQSDDVNMLVKYITEETTKEPTKEKPEKNPAAFALCRLGGLKEGIARWRKESVE